MLTAFSEDHPTKNGNSLDEGPRTVGDTQTAPLTSFPLLSWVWREVKNTSNLSHQEFSISERKATFLVASASPRPAKLFLDSSL